MVMAFHISSALTSPLFGYWSNKMRHCKLPIILGTILSIVGNCLLAFAPNFGIGHKWVLLAARIITGLGAGNAGALFAYVAVASTLAERNKAVAIRAAVNSLALILGPAVQARSQDFRTGG